MNIYRQAIEFIDSGKPFAWAMVVRAAGSTPQKAGAKAIFERDGTIHGTLGGGCLESEARQRALSALDVGLPFVFDLSLDEDYGWDDGLICGGSVRIFVDPAPTKSREAWVLAIDALERGERGVLITPITNSNGLEESVRWVPESEIDEFGDFPGGVALRSCLDSEKPRLERESQGEKSGAEIYVEPIERAPVLIIAGGGNVGQATARLGAWLGFEVVVVDDRPAFTDTSLYPPGVRTICGDIAGTISTFAISQTTYIVIVTRGHQHDGDALKACIHTSAAFIGMIGSKRKAHVIRQGFIDEGIATNDDFSRVYTPIGLDIGALSIEEIAVSIVSQLIAVRRKRTGTVRPLALFVPT